MGCGTSRGIWTVTVSLNLRVSPLRSASITYTVAEG